MNEPELDVIRQRFDRSFSEFGDSALGLRTGSDERARMRFEALVKPVESEILKSSVLDAGCGTGRFLDFLLSQNFSGRYVGIDISQAGIDIARAKHPDVDWTCGDFVSHGNLGAFDFVVFSQVFNFRIPGLSMEEHVRSSLNDAFSTARKGVLADFLSARVDYMEDHHSYHNPTQVLEDSFCLSRSVVLNHCGTLHQFFLAIMHESVP